MLAIRDEAVASLNSAFRGFKAIERIVARMQPLATCLLAVDAQPRVITVSRADYDMIQRCPEAAALFKIFQRADGSVNWSGFTLRPDQPKPRITKGSDRHGRQSKI